MIRWEQVGEDDGNIIYKRIDDDSLETVTAIKGYPELDAYLAESEPDSE
jgi:hypothetical protein